MRLCITVMFVGVCVALTMALPRGAADSRTEQTTSQTLHFSGGAPRALDVRTVNGSIHVSASNGSTVELTTHKTIYADSDAAMHDAERNVSIEVKDGAPQVGAIVHDEDVTCGERTGFRPGRWFEPDYQVRVDFTVRVPKETAIRLCAINGGELIVEGTSGAFDVSNVNGGVTMNEIRGSGIASTVNGSVTVLFASNPTAASQFRTVNGSIEAMFAGALAADLRMKTMHGALYTDYEVQPVPTSVVERVDRGGAHIYHANRYTVVRAGGGGPELTFDTLNGDVRILRRAR